MTAVLEARGVRKSYGPLPVLEDVHLEVRPRERVALVGPSGCGKTTLLRLLVGVDFPDAGEIRRGVERVGYLPQGGMLFPWKTVRENVELPLVLQRVGRDERRSRLERHLDRFGLAGFEGAYPRDLSGGMAQRAALLRTILTGAGLLLLDEPFGALDPITREHLQDWLAAVTADLDRTLLLVTHDLEEALVLCRRAVVLSPRPASVRGEVRSPAPGEDGRVARGGAEFLAAKEAIRGMLDEDRTGDE